MSTRPKPKKPPLAQAIDGFHAALGVASAQWEEAAAAIVNALADAAYLKNRTQNGKAQATRIVADAILPFVPIGGSIDGAHAKHVARAALDCLAQRGMLTDRPMSRLTQE